MKLVNPADRDLNQVFMRAICGKSMSMVLDVPRFTESADLVLPYLEKWNGEDGEVTIESADGGWVVRLWNGSVEMAARRGESPIGWILNGEETRFPRAAVIALLRAHDVEIEFTKETS